MAQEVTNKRFSLNPTIVRTLAGTLLGFFFIFSTIGFWRFETNFYLRIFYFVIIFASIIEFSFTSRILGFIMLTYYLTFFTLINLLYSGQLGVWAIFIITLPITASIVSLWKKSNRVYWKRIDTLIWVTISILILELLIIFRYLSLPPYIQSFILLLLPLLAFELYSDFREENFYYKRTIRLVVLLTISIVIIILSTPIGVV